MSSLMFLATYQQAKLFFHLGTLIRGLDSFLVPFPQPHNEARLHNEPPVLHFPLSTLFWAD